MDKSIPCCSRVAQQLHFEHDWSVWAYVGRRSICVVILIVDKFIYDTERSQKNFSNILFNGSPCETVQRKFFTVGVQYIFVVDSNPGCFFSAATVNKKSKTVAMAIVDHALCMWRVQTEVSAAHSYNLLHCWWLLWLLSYRVECLAGAWEHCVLSFATTPAFSRCFATVANFMTVTNPLQLLVLHVCVKSLDGAW